MLYTSGHVVVVVLPVLCATVLVVLVLAADVVVVLPLLGAEPQGPLCLGCAVVLISLIFETIWTLRGLAVRTCQVMD